MNTENALEIRGLKKDFDGFRLGGFDLTLPGGCIMGLVGENGAGKSTTVKLILNMLRKDGGSVTVLGRDSEREENLIKEDTGVVLDEVGLPDCMTVAQTGKMMSHIFENWDGELYRKLTAKLALPEDKPFSRFSKGMKMKLGIVAAMSHGAKLLILDEATSGLDPVARDEILQMLTDFTRDEEHSVLISSHIVSDLEKLCDYVAFLHKGQLMLCEEKDVLLSEYGMLSCTEGELDRLLKEAPSAVKYRHVTGYGAQALILKKALRSGASGASGGAGSASAPAGRLSPVSLEELFVLMSREGN